MKFRRMSEVDLRGKPAKALVVKLPFYTKGSLRR